jgi:methylglutaconyl-CoA hydratase
LNYSTIVVTDDGPIRTITLNRPERRNAMTLTMQTELITSMEDAATSACRVLVFAGAGEAFCSGLDLTALQAMKDQSDIENRADAERIALLFRTLYELPKPTIAAVHGAAIAGGTGLAAICDYTVAVATAKFGYTEVRIGFVPAIVSAYLALQIGDKRARDLLLSGRLFDAAEAYRLGLVNEIVPAEQLAARVRALAESLAANSPKALAATKRLLAVQNRAWLETAITAAMEANAQARETVDFYEGVTAFLEKRKPVWK